MGPVFFAPPYSFTQTDQYIECRLHALYEQQAMLPPAA